ncbi:hypothetical protein BLNAU_11793 [Blattamonas nauphoetae]|uniref:Uncharacterized protein n=1 Tax=Blattamonas nauphoetae TaxID=2049346 RepID=A0ABQ9XP91_9EUKA|nr:hypothetical protein BLNAU_11793 [Blattamonas nauphoetae]
MYHSSPRVMTDVDSYAQSLLGGRSAAFTPPASPYAAYRSDQDVLFPSQNHSPTSFDDDYCVGFADPEFWAFRGHPIDETIPDESFSTQNPSAQQDERNEAVNGRAEMKQGFSTPSYEELRHPDAYRSSPPVAQMQQMTASPQLALPSPFTLPSPFACCPNAGRSRTRKRTRRQPANAQRDGAPAKKPKKGAQMDGQLSGLTVGEGESMDVFGKSHVRVGKGTVRIDVAGLAVRREVEINQEFVEKGRIRRNTQTGSGKEEQGSKKKTSVQISKECIQSVTIDRDVYKRTSFVRLSFLVRDTGKRKPCKKGTNDKWNPVSALFDLVDSNVTDRHAVSLELKIKRATNALRKYLCFLNSSFQEKLE